MKKIGITTGDPAGIGAEIVAKSLKYRRLSDKIIYIIYGENYKDSLKTEKVDSVEQANHSNILYHIKIGKPVSKGKPSKESGKIAYEILERCANDLKQGKLDAVVTAPVAKYEIAKTYPNFIGHTEFFAEFSGTNTDDVIMSFWSESFNMALLTTHLSITEAIKKLTYEYILNKLKLIDFHVKKHIKSPKTAIIGVNPHAGENGKFGETDEIIKRAIKELNKSGIKIDGPFPADSFFSQKYSEYDFIISPLHDEGLIPFKLLNYGEGVNVTLGLPFVRTSPDHGTAFDIAEKDIANENSMRKAIDIAENFLNKQPRFQKAYSAFAKYYDDYMEHVNYDDWVNLILQKYEKYSSYPLRNVYELACGTANISTRLVKKGYNVYASDNSEDMLMVADKKEHKPLLFNSDFLQPIPIKDLDLVLLIFDSINYISNENDILTLIKNVFDALNYNGIFIFDISTLKNCRDNFDGFVNLEDNENSYFIHESGIVENKLISKLVFFERNGFIYKKREEKHTQYIYKVENILNMIKKSRLTLKGYFALCRSEVNLLKTPLSPNEIDNDYERIFFVLKKEI